MGIAEELRGKALELGFEGLGAVALGELAGYLERVDERERRVPLAKGGYDFMRGLARPERHFPEARSLVVGILDIGRYRIPTGAAGLIGRHYLFDPRRNPRSPEALMVSELTGFMGRLGLKAAANENPGIAPMRWAAWKAGLGVIRQNNFFYTATGSWKQIVAWAIDRELEMPSPPAPAPCPEGCGKCVAACPTGSLSGPYVMNMATCVSYLTNIAPWEADEELLRQMGGWLYGCDACQDACPFNRAGDGTQDFPGLEETARKARPESILAMGLDEIERELAWKFFYIKKESLHCWKLNALNVIANTGRADLVGTVRGALEDPNLDVRLKAAWTLQRLGAT
ncbi:MAG: epoxyqueuosine reductase [Deltaproteobacteria bacterium]|nr:epoxyqueuosine reductase [Deltaproteobacteria bacterium]